MFERYTEHARRVIFFARYEASQFGAEAIEPEHLLLALYRDDAALMNRFAPGSQAEVRKQIEHRIPRRPKVSTGVDMPLSHVAKRVLAYGAEEAEQLNDFHIRVEHLLLGLLRQKSLASSILESLGVALQSAREQIAHSGVAGGGSSQEGHSYTCHMENGTGICETHRRHKGHRITLIEKLRVSEDGKILHYSQELLGPKGEHAWSQDFDIT